MKRTVLIATAVLLFVAISALLARFLSVENAERDDLLALLQSQSRGDAAGMIARMPRCARTPSCVATARADATSLRRPGAVKILSVKSKTAYSLTGSTGVTRLAWTVIGRLPVVQCVQVSRTGNALVGIHVHLLSISAQIPGEADCRP